MVQGRAESRRGGAHPRHQRTRDRGTAVGAARRRVRSGVGPRQAGGGAWGGLPSSSSPPRNLPPRPPDLAQSSAASCSRFCESDNKTRAGDRPLLAGVSLERLGVECDRLGKGTPGRASSWAPRAGGRGGAPRRKAPVAGQGSPALRSCSPKSTPGASGGRRGPRRRCGQRGGGSTPRAGNQGRGAQRALLQPASPASAPWHRKGPHTHCGLKSRLQEVAESGAGTCSPLSVPRGHTARRCQAVVLSSRSLCTPSGRTAGWPAPGPGTHKQEGGNPACPLRGREARSLPGSDLHPGREDEAPQDPPEHGPVSPHVPSPAQP